MSRGSAGRRWLILGAEGMLGHDLMTVVAGEGHVAIGQDLPDVDITDPNSVDTALDRVHPDVVVNAAAFTAVDAAEEQEQAAHRVNGLGPEVVSRAIAERPSMRLVHVSTDYVFDGEAITPYPEHAEPRPRSAYGRTKLAGERAVLGVLPARGYVIRTAWLYGEHGPNFVKTMLALEQTKPELMVVDDQHGQPTWSRDLAQRIVTVLDAAAPAGIYHGTASGQTTWYGLTREIFRLIGADPQRVRPTTTDQFPRPAPRPAFSVLGHDAWSRVGLPPMRAWDEALAEALPLLRA